MESTRPRLVLNPPPNIKRVLCTQDVDELIEFLENNLEVGFDVETTPLKDFYWRRMRTIQFGTKDKQFVIDLLAFCDGDSELLYNCQGEYGKNLHKAPQLHALMHRLAPFLCSDKYLKVGVNLQFEYEQFYWLTGLRTYGFYCCMLAEKCIYAGLGGQASLKNYSFYSMDEMMDRYFHVSIDKELQTSFNLEDELTDNQYEYAAVDVRTPLAIKYVQSLIANADTVESLAPKGKFPAEYLRRVDKAVLGDNLNRIIQIENNALGAFGDMYIHGENFDSAKWLKRVAGEKEEFKLLLTQLDKFFLPIVGSKHDVASDAIIEAAEAEWKTYNIPTEEETTLFLEIRKLNREIKKNSAQFDSVVENTAKVSYLCAQVDKLELARKAKKEDLKAACSDLKKKRTKAKNLFEKCEGEALINYGSDAQLLHALHEHDPKQFKKIEGLDEEAFETYDHIPIIKLIGQYHVLAKKIETYGDSWGQQWKTHPCLEEGWLHPGDGRLHGKFNQYDAETGRTSSEQPNCFSDDTDVLTEHGWVPFKQLKEGCKVAQYNRSDGYISFEKPLKMFAMDGPTALLNLKSEKFIDFLVTQDHDMPLLHRKTGKWNTYKASDYASDKMQIVAGKYKDGYTNYSDNQVILMCAVQADAHVKENGIDWGFTKERKYIRLIDALGALHIPYKDYSNNKRYRVFVKSEDVPTWLQNRKHWDSEVLTLDQKTLEFLSEEVYHWDGCLKNKSMYSSSVEMNTDWLQIVSILTDKRANKREYKNALPNSKINYQIDVTRQNYSLTTNVAKVVTKYNGKIYCVSTPCGTVVVRRNGIPAITGNCQNIPKDKDTRSCFISDPPDEGLQLSDCCDYFITWNGAANWCNKCGQTCTTHAADMSTITIDMAGAELRILAEEAKEPVWIKAFANDEDVHSECSEMVEGEDFWKSIAEPTCAYFKVKENGQLSRVKCKCKSHNEIRDGMKTTNFGLPYGAGERTICKQTGKPVKIIRELLTKHKAAFPTLWSYLEKSGNEAKMFKKAIDMFGRRRIFPEPTWERATSYAKEDLKDRLKLPDEESKKNLSVFEQLHKRKPTQDEKWLLTHRNPNNKEISKAFQGLFGSIERQGKNHKIQSANASIIKLAMGCGYDSKENKPYLWHIFPKYRARLQKMVHDELGISVPTIYAEEVAALTQDAIRRAAAEKMSLVVMKSDYRISKHWEK